MSKSVEKQLSYRRNVIRICSVEEFLNVRGGYRNMQKDVYFVRALGESEGFAGEILRADERMRKMERSGQIRYARVKELPRGIDARDAAFYAKEYDGSVSNQKIGFQNLPGGAAFQNAACFGLKEVLGIYREERPNASESMIRNFGTKLLFWADRALGGLLEDWNEQGCFKLVAENVLREQEYLFFYFATLLGCDVLLLEQKKEAELSGRLKGLAQEIKLGSFGTSDLPAYRPDEAKPERGGESRTTADAARQNETAYAHRTPVVVIPKRERRARPAGGHGPSCRPDQKTASHPAARAEKSFEELAELASSVVMIAIYDQRGDMRGSGSGIMIGRQGYILTNYHVISGGQSFAVRMEDGEKAYHTDEVIKYNYNLDLAVIRICKELAPIPIYKGGAKLVRGQKVVAIGSPLGLFNSVSDGIISGFRTIRDVDMIQFTAPISPGSSGGAVLNMNGEVIGISTAGMDDGQNLNLAVGYADILTFARGFF